VLDAVVFDRAHVMGLSMGGVIVQVMAIEHADRLLSMTSVMSRTGEQEYGGSTAEAFALLTAPRPPIRRPPSIATSKAFACGEARNFSTRSAPVATRGGPSTGASTRPVPDVSSSPSPRRRSEQIGYVRCRRRRW